MGKLHRLFSHPLMISGLVGVGLCLLFLWPVITHFSTHLTSPEDGLLIVYLINWITVAFTEGYSLFTVPFFHPYLNTLAYSVPFLSTGILTVPLKLFTHNLVAIHNFHLVIGCWVVFLSMFGLAKYLYRQTWLAIIVATLFTFGWWHFNYVGHLHMWLVAGLPVCILSLLKWVETKKIAWLWLSASAFLYQTLNSPETGLFLMFIVLPIIWQPNIRTVLWQNWKVVGLIGLLTALIIGSFYLPYVRVSQEFKYTRSIRDAAHFAHSLNQIIEPEFLMVFVLIGGGWWLARFKKPNQPSPLLTSKTLWLIAMSGLLLMLGPALKINDQTFKVFNIPIPLPYAIFYYGLPFFQAFRTTSRWIVVLGFGLSLLVGHNLAKLRLKTSALLGLQVIVVIFLWLTQINTIHLFFINQQVPVIYSAIPTSNAAVLAEFPVYIWRMMPYAGQENTRLFYQTHHGVRLFNGVSGFTPPQREQDVNGLWQNFPSPESISYLKSQGVTTILVHHDEYERMSNDKYVYNNQASQNPLSLKLELNSHHSLQLITCDTYSCLYTIK